MQNIIEKCYNFTNHKPILWQIVSGINAYNTKSKKFEYLHNNTNITKKLYTFLNKLIYKVHEWINIVYQIYFNKTGIQYFENKYIHDILHYNSLMYHIRCDSLHQWQQNM